MANSMKEIENDDQLERWVARECQVLEDKGTWAVLERTHGPSTFKFSEHPRIERLTQRQAEVVVVLLNAKDPSLELLKLVQAHETEALYPDEPEKDRCFCIDCKVELPRGYRHLFTACDGCWANHYSRENVALIDASMPAPRRGLAKGRLEEIESLFDGCTKTTVLPEQVERLAHLEFSEAKLFAYSRVIIPELIAEIRRHVANARASLSRSIEAAQQRNTDEMAKEIDEAIYRELVEPLIPIPFSGPCAVCGKSAICVGAYEDQGNLGLACDDCCGHGNEDGWCRPVKDLGELLAELADTIKVVEETNYRGTLELIKVKEELARLETIIAADISNDARTTEVTGG